MNSSFQAGLFLKVKALQRKHIKAINVPIRKWKLTSGHPSVLQGPSRSKPFQTPSQGLRFPLEKRSCVFDGLKEGHECQRMQPFYAKSHFLISWSLENPVWSFPRSGDLSGGVYSLSDSPKSLLTVFWFLKELCPGVACNLWPTVIHKLNTIWLPKILHGVVISVILTNKTTAAH